MGRLSQPQQAARVDWSNPITRGLVGAFNPAAGLQSNNLILSSGTGTLDAIAVNGRALLTNANQESRYTTWRRSDGAMTVAWLGDLIASPTADACLGGVTHNDTNAGPYVAIEIKRRNGTAHNLYLNWSFGSAAANHRILLTAGTAYTSNKNLLLIGGVSSGLQSLSVYQNKALVERVTAANADTINYGAGPRVEMGDSLNARDPNALHNLMLLWNRQLSTREERILADNPWQIFEAPRSFQVYVDVGAVSASITGQSLSVSQGSLTGNVQTSVTGQALTASLGAVVGGVSTSIAGQALALSQGQITAAIQAAITGQALSVAQGALTGSVSYPITGQALNVALGNVTTGSEIFVSIAGQALSVYQGQVIAAISPTITGQSLAVSRGMLTGAVTSSITGQALSLSQGALAIPGALPRVGISNTSGHVGISNTSGYVGISNTSGYVGITTIQ